MSRHTGEVTNRMHASTGRTLFVRCPVCGHYAAPEERSGGLYCSPACAEKFLRCTTCGRYYPAAGAASDEHCSSECAARYSLQRSYGPAQVDIRMEDLI
jgi:hypothetical protein